MKGYLLVLPILKHMSIIARFRMSSHTLAIETGRHAKPKITIANVLISMFDSLLFLC